MKAVLTVLGSGTSMGVPTIGCSCRVCTSSDPHDQRTRPSIMLQYDGHCVLIDTTPDFRQQAIREHIRRIDAILYTHAHADHILGLDDVRPLSFRHGSKIPLYAHDSTATALESIFQYIFDANYKYGGIARVEMKRFNGSIDLFGASFEPVEIIHGETTIHGFRFGRAAYLTDFSEIPPQSMQQLLNLDILFLDALRHNPHPTHSTVANSLRLVEELKPARAFFTHISHDLPHEETNQSFPEHVRLAHDGLKLEFDIA
ncbi:MAG TPA: MBL fold metallo-hydrolase [Candidatus Angelobacter sp.]|nr:MBL fold metallo-hydrolase [Candidatus Angelobacter sp.]